MRLFYFLFYFVFFISLICKTAAGFIGYDSNTKNVKNISNFKKSAVNRRNNRLSKTNATPIPASDEEIKAGIKVISKQNGRIPFIAGNWKLNPATLTEAIELGKKVSDAANDNPDVNVAVMIPYPFIRPVYDAIGISSLGLGAQDLYTQDKGAYTSAISTSMLKSVGAHFVLCGHSERRSIFKDNDMIVNEKMKKALSTGLAPILCIGETKEEYELGKNEAICAAQLEKGLKDINKEDMMKVVIAYEPVWAIGTGLTCPPEVAQKVHSFIRGHIRKMYNDEIADNIIIQYGGSVTPDTINDLIACKDIDGALVGGAALDANKFEKIISACSSQ